MKTDIWIAVNEPFKPQEKMRIKLDANKFPYVIFHNEKCIITSSNDYETKWIHGLYSIKIEVVENREKLADILANPDLTVDKLSVHNLARII